MYVIIGPNTNNIETAVAQALAPFDEDRAVRPYKLHLSASTVTAMAKYYNIPETDLAGLIAKMSDWLGDAGGNDHLGLYARCSHNPDGKWDWYQIGGRFNGRISGDCRSDDARGIDHNMVPVSDLIAAPDFAARVPAVVVTPYGEWIARSVFVTTSAGWHVRDVPRRRWRERVRRILKAFPNHRVVCVDAHH